MTPGAGSLATSIYQRYLMARKPNTKHEWVGELEAHARTIEILLTQERGARERAEAARSQPSPEELAEFFHHAYEGCAPSHGYETRIDSRGPWKNVPENQKALMVEVSWAALKWLRNYSQRPPPGQTRGEGE